MMTQKELREKYGDERVLVIPASAMTCMPNKGPYFREDEVEFCAKKDGLAMYRWQAEGDPGYKQLVVYAVIGDGKGHVYCTHRKAGDSRLTGKYSIGTGGHVQPDETATEALFRELHEEVGISPDDITVLTKNGFIYDDSSWVNSVHLGLVYAVVVDDPSIVKVVETEKLDGEWVDSNGLTKLSDSGSLEAWSEYIWKDFVTKEG